MNNAIAKSLQSARELDLTTTGRASGQPRTVELWFAFDDGKLYFLAHEDSDWWKNIAKSAEVEVAVSEIVFTGTARLIQEKLTHVFGLFRKKYGDSQVERWYSGSRSQRRAVEVELLRVLGKRPTGKTLLEVAI